MARKVTLRKPKRRPRPRYKVGDVVRFRKRPGGREVLGFIVQRHWNADAGAWNYLLQHPTARGDVRTAEAMEPQLLPNPGYKLDAPQQRSVCAWCKRLYVGRTGARIRKATPAELKAQQSHGICRPCRERLFAAERERTGKVKVPNRYTGRVRGNEVYFTVRGKRRLGWIHKSTPKRYLIWTPDAPPVWRYKRDVEVVGTRRNAGGQLQEALTKSAEFHGFVPRRIRKVSIKWPRALVHLGPCVQLDYVSDKHDGKLRQYFHEFKSRCELYAAPAAQPNGDGLLILKGKFKVKPEGITG